MTIKDETKEQILQLHKKVDFQYEQSTKLAVHHAYLYQNIQASHKQINNLSEGDINNQVLYGMTIAVKDNIEVAGMPNTLGNKALASHIPQHDACIITRLKEAGAVINGKANMHELALGVTNINPSFGHALNAYNPEYFAGGSSGGTAVAVALGLADAGIGTDTGGSSRIPAALNGIVGFRPTTGRYPNDGLGLISKTRDTAGPMAKDVATLARLDAVLAGDPSIDSLPSFSPKKLRLGIPRTYFYGNTEPAVLAAVEQVLQALSKAGVTLVEVDICGVEELNQQISFPVVLYEAKQHIQDYIEKALPDTAIEDFAAQICSEDVKNLVDSMFNQPIPERMYQEAINSFRPKLQGLYQDYFDKHRLDAVIFPATPLTAQKITNDNDVVMLNGREEPTFSTYIRNADPASNAGIPGLVIPIGFNPEGLPISLEIDGPAGSDRQVLIIGKLIETIIKNV